MKKFNKNLKIVLETTLNLVTKKVPSLNNGGCGVFALLLGEKLEAMGFLVEYCYVLRYKKDNKYIDNAVYNNDVFDINYASWCHVVLKVNNRYFIDSGGIFLRKRDIVATATASPYGGISTPTPKEMVETHVSIECEWNNEFNRKKEKPKIEKLLNEHLVI
jgi:hypothetical protein